MASGGRSAAKLDGGSMGLLPVAAAVWAAAATLFLQLATARGGAVAAPPAIYVFGDSTADVGNNNYLPNSTAKANFPFNGIDYPGGKPTGRFCNSYIGVDYIAMRMRLRESPPAYLSVAGDFQSLRGINFASAASGILDSTGQGISISMNTQIQFFQQVRRRMRARLGRTLVDSILSEALFVFSVGSNDIFAFAATGGLVNRTRADQFIQSLVHQFGDQLETLYKLGARKFVVFGSSLVGCVPLLRLTSPSGGCVEPLNEFSMRFKNATELLLRDLATGNNGISYSFIDTYEFVTAILSEPLSYGLKEVGSACCGSGRLNAEAPCTPSASYCPNRTEYYNWDQVHPTTAVYKLIADLSYLGAPRFVRPMNIQQLLRGLPS